MHKTIQYDNGKGKYRVLASIFTLINYSSLLLNAIGSLGKVFTNICMEISRLEESVDTIHLDHLLGNAVSQDKTSRNLWRL
jgi:hypothetical protein